MSVRPRPRERALSRAADPDCAGVSEEQMSVTEELVDNVDQGRFEYYRYGDLVGWLYYTHLRPDRYALRHTEVEPSHQH